MKKYIFTLCLLSTLLGHFQIPVAQEPKVKEECVISQEEQEPIIPITPDVDLTQSQPVRETQSFMENIIEGIKSVAHWFTQLLVSLKNSIVSFFKS